MLSSMKNILLVGTLALTTTACSKARMTHTQATPQPVVTTTDDKRPVVEPVAPVGPPIVVVPLDPRYPEQPHQPRTPQDPIPTTPIARPVVPVQVDYTDTNNRLSMRTIYDCQADAICEPVTAAPAPTPAPAPAPAPTPAPTPAPVAERPPAYQEVCSVQSFSQPSPELVDILVVVDTAGPNFDRTDLTAKAIAAYAKNQTLRQRHVRVGMIPAHGSRSEHSGLLYKPVPSNPFVIDSLELEETNDNFEWFARTNVDFMPEDVFSDGGQSGLYSLHKALTVNFNTIKNQGLFREGATQHILFISNEADVCAESFADPTPERARNSKAMDSEYPELTREAAARLRDCEQSGFEQQDLVDRIQQLKREYHITVSAIVPTDRNRFQELTPFNSEETEVGSGYIEVAEQTGGNIYDLFDLKKSQAGLAQFAGALESQFNEGLAMQLLTSEFRLQYEGFLSSVRPVIMDRIYDQALLQQDLPEECKTLDRYNSSCPNMKEARFTLSAETSVSGNRNTSTVNLVDLGKFDSKIEISFCSTVPVN